MDFYSCAGCRLSSLDTGYRSAIYNRIEHWLDNRHSPNLYGNVRIYFLQGKNYNSSKFGNYHSSCRIVIADRKRRYYKHQPNSKQGGLACFRKRIYLGRLFYRQQKNLAYVFSPYDNSISVSYDGAHNHSV